MWKIGQNTLTNVIINKIIYLQGAAVVTIWVLGKTAVVALVTKVVALVTKVVVVSFELHNLPPYRFAQL